MILGEHEKNGAKVYTNKITKNLQFKGDKNGNIQSVKFESGFEIPADMIIFGGGINLNT
jgi:NAD(P)H-nitrite reductase large subunit